MQCTDYHLISALAFVLVGYGEESDKTETKDQAYHMARMDTKTSDGTVFCMCYRTNARVQYSSVSAKYHCLARRNRNGYYWHWD